MHCIYREKKIFFVYNLLFKKKKNNSKRYNIRYNTLLKSIIQKFQEKYDFYVRIDFYVEFFLTFLMFLMFLQIVKKNYIK